MLLRPSSEEYIEIMRLFLLDETWVKIIGVIDQYFTAKEHWSSQLNEIYPCAQTISVMLNFILQDTINLSYDFSSHIIDN